MLTSVIIILRESLEISILISLLAVLHLKFSFYRQWFLAAIFFGFGSAFLYAKSLGAVSVWFDGSGQEVINGFSLCMICLCLIYHSTYVNYFYNRKFMLTDKNRLRKNLLSFAISATLILVIAITREGSESFIYYMGVSSHPEKISSMIIGGVIGGGLGICIGILLFVSLYELTNKKIVIITSIIFILITSGAMAEATKSFIQAGWLMPGEPLWDTSNFIPESSIIGQMLYAIFFYEATPTPQEVTMWIVTFICHISLLLGVYYLCPTKLKS